ncbi:MAG: hypothetical protein RLZZ119_1087, partial [Pseudomonadota bacterium]
MESHVVEPIDQSILDGIRSQPVDALSES